MSTTRRTLWTDVALNSAARELLEPHADVVEGSAPACSRIEEADGIIAGSLLPANGALFMRAPRLQVIARVGMGFDNVDLTAATAAGVCAVNTPDAPTESTAEFTIALMLAVARRVAFGDRTLRTGQWSSGPELLGFDLEGKTLGLIGCGRIGKRVSEIALAFRMKVLVYDPIATTLPPGVERVEELGSLLGSSDVVALHVPLTATTRQLINARTLALMKRGSVLLNTSRGPVVDEPALVAALQSGHLAGAGIDVWSPEPPRSDHPLFALPNLVVTPHMAAFTREGRVRSHSGAASQVMQVWRGERPAGLLNPEVWSARRTG